MLPTAIPVPIDHLQLLGDWRHVCGLRDSTYAVARAMAAPSLCTSAPEGQQDCMTAPVHRPAAAHPKRSDNAVKLERRLSSSSGSSSSSSTSSSGCSSISSGLCTQDASLKSAAGWVSAAGDFPACDAAPQPISPHNDHGAHEAMQTLPRADVLILGGDLAYPNPSNETYEKRFFR